MNTGEKILFLSQLSLLAVVSRISNVPIYSIRLPLAIGKNKTLLPFLWKNSEQLVPKWFSDFDFDSLQGKILLDIGSHIGLFSAVFLKKGGKKHTCLISILPLMN